MGRVGILIKWFNPATSVCLSEAKTWIINAIMLWSFLLSMVQGEGWSFVLLILVELLAITVNFFLMVGQSI